MMLDNIVMQTIAINPTLILKTLEEKCKLHPRYLSIKRVVEGLEDIFEKDQYHIIGISPNRDGFDNIYEKYSIYHSGDLIELKVDDEYIMCAIKSINS
jgi:hypothetical protein